MKTRITRKEAERIFPVMVDAGNLEKLLMVADYTPEYYNAGSLGWNWDIYNVDGFGVVNGYRNTPAGCIKPSRDDMDRLNAAGRDLSRQAWPFRMYAARDLLSEWLEGLTK